MLVDGDCSFLEIHLLIDRDVVEMEWLIIRHQSWAHATFCHRYTEMPKNRPHTPEQCVKTVPT